MAMIVQEIPQTGDLRRGEMRTPDEVAVMLRLKGLGWGARRIAIELGCSKNTVKRYLAAGGWLAYLSPSRFAKLDGWRRGWPSASGGMRAMPTWCARTCRGRVC